MQKFLRTLTLLALLSMPWVSNAQETVTIGTGTGTTYVTPFNSLWGYSFVEQIYLASEIETNGNITAVRFYLGTAPSGVQTNNITLYMKNVTRSTFSSATDYEPVTASDVVYTGTFNIPTTTGWVEILLDTPFDYDGSSNLLVAMHEYTSGYSTRNFTYTNTPNSVVSFHSDSANPDPYNLGSYSGNSYTSPNRANIQLDITPAGGISCYKATHVNIVDSLTTSTSLTLSWKDTRNASATYSVYNMSDTSLVMGNIYDTFYTVTDLESNTSYSFAVMADCGGGDVAGLTSAVAGRTACAAISLPYTMGFEEDEIPSMSNSIPFCWTRINTLASGTYTYYPYSNASNPFMGSRSLYFYGYNSASYADTTGFVMPELDVNTFPMNGNRVTFWGKVSSTTPYTVIVGTMTDPNDRTTFTVADTVTVTGTTYTKYSVSLAEAEATDPYVAFIVPKVASAMYIDDVTLEEIPSCLEVSNVTVDSVTSTSISLSWMPNEANPTASYSIYNMSDTSLVESSIYDTFYTVTDLEPNTPYTFGVQANCGSGDASIIPVNGRTSCSPEALPFSETFDATLANDQCWRGASIVYTDSVVINMGTNTNWTYSSAESNGIAAGHYRVNIYGTSCYKWMITPDIDLSEATNPMLSFNAAFTAYNGTGAASGFEGNATQKFMVLVSTNNGTSWNIASDISLSSLVGTSYTLQVVNLAPYAGQTVRLAFYAQSTTSGGDNNLHIDDILVEESEGDYCYPVSGLAATNVTHDSVILTWDGTVDSYNVYAITATDTTLIETVTDTFLVIDTLLPMTSYTFGVTSICSDGESFMSSVSFNSACAPLTLPFSESFDATLADNQCWRGASIVYTDGVVVNMGANTNWTYTSSESNGIAAGHYRVNIYGTSCYKWMITPELDLTEATNPMLSFNAAFTKYTGTGAATGFDGNESQKFIIFVSTDNGTTWDTASNISLASIASDAYLPQVVNLAPYAGETIRIAFYAQSTVSGGDNNLHIDDILVLDSEGEYCYPVTNLTASNVTADEATLSWNGTAASYNVYALTATDTTLVQNVVDTFFVVDNLTATTNYTYGVTAVCTDGESTLMTVSFATQCTAMSLPYYESFADSSASRNCWTLVSNNTANASGSNGMGYMIADGRSVIRFSSFSSATDYNQYAYSPQLEVSSDATNVGVQVTYATRSADYLYFGYITPTDTVWDPTAYNTNSSSTSFNWETAEFVIPTNAIQLVVRYYGNCQYYAWVDSVAITEMTGDYCYPVSGLTVDSTTSTSVFLSWNDDNNSGATYTIMGSDSTVIATGIAGLNYEVTGLTANTTYTFIVVTNCSATSSSNAVNVTATTACEALTLPYSESFDATLANDQCWNGASAVYSDGMSVDMGANTNWTYTSSESNGIPAGHYRVNIYGTSCYKWMITPSIDLGTATNPMLTFNAVFTAYSGTGAASGFEGNTSQKFMVLVSTNNGASWNTASDISLSSIAGTSYALQVVGLNAYAGQTIRLAFYAQSTVSGGDNNLHIDDILVQDSEGDFCYPVTGLTVDSTTTSSVFLSWTDENNSGATYTILGSDSSVVASGISGLSYEVTGLSASTSYTFSVVTNCSETSASNAATVSAFTNCGAVSLPFSESFDATLANNMCWNGASILYTDSVNVTMGANTNWTYSSAESNGIAAGHYRVNIYGSSCYKWMITPEIDLSMASNPVLSFNAVFTKYSGTGAATGFESNTSQKFMVLVSTNNGTTWTTASDISLASIADTAYVPQNVNLAAYIGETIRIAFYAQSTVSGGDNNLHIDDILVQDSVAVADNYTVTLTSADSAMGSVSPAGTQTVAANASFTATATANSGYHFVAWMRGATQVSTANPYTFTVTANTTLTATFAADEPVVTYYTVSANTADATMGSASVTPNGQVAEGTTVTFTATEADGYHFVNWTNAAGAVVSTANPYTTTVTADLSLTANFEANAPVEQYFTVNISSADQNMGTVSSTHSGQVLEGTVVTATATSNHGYHFTHWSNGSTDSVYTFTVTADVNLVAHFEANVGIDEANSELHVTIYTTDNKIVVNGVEGRDVTVFDVTGRMVCRQTAAADRVEMPMQTAGVYLVKVANLPAKRVAIVR
jgi:uncharacterized repeat protein (TIGR02543 family)